MQTQQEDKLRQGISDLKGEAAIFPDTVLPGALNGLERLVLPGNIRFQND